MDLTKWARNNPFKEMFDDLLGDTGIPWLGRKDGVQYLKPAVDIFEDTDFIVIKVSLPGIKKNDIDIVIEDGVLHIRGEIKKDDRVKDENYYKRERYYGSFQRSFALGDSVEADEINAGYEDGVLTIEMPKVKDENGKPIRKIDVT